MRAHSSKKTVLFTLALALGFSGCASGGGGPARPAGASANRIVTAELETLQQFDAYQAVERLRPRWLQARVGLTGPTMLYVDGAPGGTAEDLRQLRASEVTQMEYMGSSDATTRYGSGHDGGAIIVRTR